MLHVAKGRYLPIIFSSGRSNEYLIILDFLQKEVDILIIGFSDFYSISSSSEIINYFIFTSWINKYCEILYACAK